MGSDTRAMRILGFFEAGEEDDFSFFFLGVVSVRVDSVVIFLPGTICRDWGAGRRRERERETRPVTYGSPKIIGLQMIFFLITRISLINKNNFFMLLIMLVNLNLLS